MHIKWKRHFLNGARITRPKSGIPYLKKRPASLKKKFLAVPLAVLSAKNAFFYVLPIIEPFNPYVDLFLLINLWLESNERLSDGIGLREPYFAIQ